MPFEELKVLLTMLQHYNPEIPITHMVKVLCTKDSNDEFTIIYEDLGEVTIINLLSDNSEYTKEDDFISIAYEVAKSLKDLKNFNIAHKGIHPSNIYKVNGVIKLGLPMLNFSSQEKIEFNGDKYFYKAPDKRMSTLTDIWSFGVFLLDIFKERARCANLLYAKNSKSTNIPVDVQKLAMRCLRAQSTERIQAKEIL